METAVQSNKPAGMTSRSSGLSMREEDHQEDFSELVSEVSAAMRRYCDRRPRVVLGCVFAFGFFCGWKMRPW